MANPWFLDLDGAKSGPYQTQEVLSLVAEGEVLSHHLISPTLKEGPWISVLEWRLSQANLVPKPVPAANVPSPTLTSQPNYIPAAPAAAEPEPKKSQPIHSPLNAPAPYTPPENVVDAPKKDPAAEMFDALHKSKQKREEKLIQAEKAHAAAGQADIYSTTSTQTVSTGGGSSSGGSSTFIRTVLAGAAISIFGFWLGQWFQKSAAPHAQAPAPVAAATPTATPTATAHPIESAATTLEDRSTDKITIRGRVAPRPATLPPNGGTLNAEPEPSATPGPKDLKELQDLKKELQELKNLKEELKNSIHDDGFEEGADLPENGAGEPTNPDSNSRY